MRLIAYVVLAAGALIAGAFIAQKVQSPQATVSTAASTASVTQQQLLDLTGASRRLQEWEGKVLLVNFWATWCAPCREEIPHIQQARARYRGKGFEVIGIALDEPDPVRAFRDALQIQYPLLLATGDAFVLMGAWGNEQAVLPHSVVLGRSGNVLATHSGPLLPDQLAALIEAHL